MLASATPLRGGARCPGVPDTSKCNQVRGSPSGFHVVPFGFLMMIERAALKRKKGLGFRVPQKELQFRVPTSGHKPSLHVVPDWIPHDINCYIQRA